MSNMLELLERELQRWPGVKYVVEPSSTHPKLRLSYEDKGRFLPFSKTKVASRGALNKVTELRRVLRDLGAQRNP